MGGNTSQENNFMGKPRVKLRFEQPHICCDLYTPKSGAVRNRVYGHQKILIVGDMGVGKSCILLRYSDNHYSEQYVSTIGVDFKIRKNLFEKVCNKWDFEIKMQIWDAAGQERFRTITSSYIRGSHVILVVYDITRRESFKNLREDWMSIIMEKRDQNTSIFFVGNKSDLAEDRRKIMTEEAHELEKQTGIEFLGEVSAKRGDGIGELFRKIAQKTVKFLISHLSGVDREEVVRKAIAEGKSDYQVSVRKGCDVLGNRVVRFAENGLIIEERKVSSFLFFKNESIETSRLQPELVEVNVCEDVHLVVFHIPIEDGSEENQNHQVMLMFCKDEKEFRDFVKGVLVLFAGTKSNAEVNISKNDSLDNFSLMYSKECQLAWRTPIEYTKEKLGIIRNNFVLNEILLGVRNNTQFRCAVRSLMLSVNLRIVDLSDSQMNYQKFKVVFCEFLPFNYSVTRILFDGNRVTPLISSNLIVPHLSSEGENCRITFFSFVGCQIDEKIGSDILCSLLHNSIVKTIDLSENGLDDTVVDVIQKLSTSRKKKLKLVILRNSFTERFRIEKNSSVELILGQNLKKVRVLQKEDIEVTQQHNSAEEMVSIKLRLEIYEANCKRLESQMKLMKLERQKMEDSVRKKEEKHKLEKIEMNEREESILKEIKKLRSELEITKKENETKKEIDYIAAKKMMEKKKTRFDSILEDIEKEEFWYYNPTKYFVNYGKLEFHHNISNNKFVCSFKPEKTKFLTSDSYLQQELPCMFFENVIVDITDDQNLQEFIKTIGEKFLPLFREEYQKKTDEISIEMIKYVEELVLEVHNFFTPKSTVSTDIRTVIQTGIDQSRKVRGGNNVYLGDLREFYGFCRHRATLFKFVCDFVGVRCRLESVYGFHAWNMIQLKEQFFFVDVSRTNKLFTSREYHEALEQLLGNEDRRRHLSTDSTEPVKYLEKLKEELRIEEERIKRLQRYSIDELDEEFRILKVNTGGCGDVALYQINKDIPTLFSEKEVIAIKKVRVKRDEIEEGDAIPRRYAIREASNMRILDHSSIIRVFGFWESENGLDIFISMKAMDMDALDFVTLLSDADLDMDISEKQGEILYLLLEVARGMKYLSSLNILHLDLKLKNVMIEWNKEKKEITDVRIIDFGGAKNNGVHSVNFITSEDSAAPEINDMKNRMKIILAIRKLKKDMESPTLKLSKILEIVEKITLSFRKMRNGNLSGLQEHFKFVLSLSDELKVLQKVVNLEWKDTMEESFARSKYLFELSDTPLYDCRADIFSFGVMMNDLLNGGLLPMELQGLKNKCLEVDRRDRPPLEEIIYNFRKHLSFFNEKVKSKFD